MDNGTTYFIAKDHLGSTCGVLNSSNNSKNSWYAYTPYGNVWTGSVNEDPAYKFTGQECEQEFGLYNFRAREYDPTLGIFYAADAAGQGFSPYMYCGGKPTVSIDRDGRFFGMIPVLVMAVWNAATTADNMSGGHISRWQFKDFAGGFAAGAASGGVGQLLGTPTSFLASIGEGAASGVVSGGLGAAVEGNRDVGSSMLYGGIGGAAMGALSYREVPESSEDQVREKLAGKYAADQPVAANDKSLNNFVGNVSYLSKLKAQAGNPDLSVATDDLQNGYIVNPEGKLALGLTTPQSGTGPGIRSDIAIAPNAFARADVLFMTTAHEFHNAWQIYTYGILPQNELETNSWNEGLDDLNKLATMHVENFDEERYMEIQSWIYERLKIYGR